MSTHDTPFTNVIKFPIQSETGQKEESAAPETEISEEQRAIMDSLAKLISFLQERATNIKYMIAVIGEHAPEGNVADSLAAHNIYTTPISPVDWALAMQFMDVTFKRRLLYAGV